MEVVEPSGWALAQLNVARLLAPIDSPELADFVANLDRVNEDADRAPGFIWRLKDEHGNATALRPWGEDTIVNMSVWGSVDALRDYVFGEAHVAVLRRRREWFSQYGTAHLVLWWVPDGHRPDLDEAKRRLTLLDEAGPSAAAFTLRQPFDPPTNNS